MPKKGVAPHMEERFFAAFIHCFFIALGVIIGGSIIGSLGDFATGDGPLSSMIRIADRLRIWAMVAAIGGTFDAIANLEKGLFEGTPFDLLKQALLILSAMGGVKVGITLIEWLTQRGFS